MSLFDRVQYIPTVQIQKGTKTIFSLDLLSTQYTDALRLIEEKEVYQISDVYSGRPDLIALKFYGAPEAWWIICSYNGIVNPLTELVTGKSIFIPNNLKVNELLQGAAMKDVTGEVIVV